MTKMIFTIGMMLNKRSHFTKKFYKLKFSNSFKETIKLINKMSNIWLYCETSSLKMWYSSWFLYFLHVIFIFMIQSVLHHQKVSCISDIMFLVIWSRYYWCLMQICMILKYKFAYSAARVLPYFFCQIFWFLVSALVSKFSIAFRTWSSIFVFVGDVLEHQYDNCKMLIILVQTFCFLALAFIIYRCSFGA